jgi:NAD(P)-dependent dehydrogenase (short-subunit alcohol dehydrogenase family)
MDLSGKHVLITGGSSGIGEACAIRCVALGAKVTLLARTALPLEEARKRVLASDEKASELQVTCVSADVTDAAQMKAAVVRDRRIPANANRLYLLCSQRTPPSVCFC